MSSNIDVRAEKGLNSDFPLSDFENEFVFFDKENSYLLCLGEAIIGFYNVIEVEDENEIRIEYSLLKSFRGCHFGQQFLSEIVEIVSKEYSNYKKIILMIKDNNVVSKKIAKKEKFNIDIDCMRKLPDENLDYIIYSKENEYYQSKKLCLQK